MDYIVYALVVVPLLGFMFAFTRMLPAKKLAQDSGLIQQNSESNDENSRFLLIVCLIASNVIYGIGELMMIYMDYGGFTAPESMKYPMIITFMCNGVACILQGIVGEKDISDGMLSDNAKYTRTVLKIGLIEIISVAGLVYFMSSHNGVI